MSPRRSKRDDLMTTATRLFSQHGVRRVSVEEICREAGASKMTFYRHFSNKDALVEAIGAQLSEETFAAFDAIDAQDLPFIEKIAAMTRWKAELHARLGVEFLREMVQTDEIDAEVKRRYLANLRKAQVEGHIRADVNLEFYWLVASRCSALFLEDAWRAVLPDSASFATQLRTVLWYGLLTREGGES